jgi:hypothetical protein
LLAAAQSWRAGTSIRTRSSGSHRGHCKPVLAVSCAAFGPMCVDHAVPRASLGRAISPLFLWAACSIGLIVKRIHQFQHVSCVFHSSSGVVCLANSVLCCALAASCDLHRHRNGHRADPDAHFPVGPAETELPPPRAAADVAVVCALRLLAGWTATRTCRAWAGCGTGAWSGSSGSARSAAASMTVGLCLCAIHRVSQPALPVM